MPKIDFRRELVREYNKAAKQQAAERTAREAASRARFVAEAAERLRAAPFFPEFKATLMRLYCNEFIVERLPLSEPRKRAVLQLLSEQAKADHANAKALEARIRRLLGQENEKLRERELQQMLAEAEQTMGE